MKRDGSQAGREVTFHLLHTILPSSPASLPSLLVQKELGFIQVPCNWGE